MSARDEVDIFISYSTQDRTFAETVMQKLQTPAIHVWMSTKLRRGAYWRNEIDEKLNSASIVVLIISPASMRSAYVTYEWAYSWFKLHKEPYPIYFKECKRSIGMFGRLRDDFQIPLTDCLYGEESSSELNTQIAEINSLIDELPILKAALSRLNNTDLNEQLRSDAAIQLGKTGHYLRNKAFNYLSQGLERQLSGEGLNGVVAQGIADALAELGDGRAIKPLERLYEVHSGYPPVRSSIMRALDGLRAKGE